MPCFAVPCIGTARARETKRASTEVSINAKVSPMDVVESAFSLVWRASPARLRMMRAFHAVDLDNMQQCSTAVDEKPEAFP